MISASLHRLRRLHANVRQTDHIYMVLVAVVVGLLGGFAAVGFRQLIQLVNRIAWHQGPYSLEYLAGLPAWWKLLAPAAGGLVVGLIIYFGAREAKGHGVPEVMESVAMHGGRIRPRVVLAKLFASGVCIGTGGSVGREGAIVQIVAAAGSTVGQWLRIDARRLRTLVGCGAAAGIAGTFNAPVAGALFAVEIILGDFGVTQFSPIVISSVSATVVSRHYLGNFPAFEVPAYALVHAGELFAYAGLGILAAVVAIAYVRTLYAVEDAFDRIPVWPPLLTVAGGLLIGGIGIWVPHVFGVGYEAINEALDGRMVWQFMLLLVVLKIVAVSITIGSGGSGGVFAPSLFIGAMTGGAIGTVMHLVWPASTGGVGAYALVGMGAVVAAATHAPITAILIIFEMTGDYHIILPLMISCIIATLLATRLQRGSIYTLKLLRRGIDLHRGRALNVLQPVPTREVMRADYATAAPDDGLLVLISKFIDHPGSTVFVVDAEGRLHGAITAEEIRPVMRDPAALEALLIAEDLSVSEGIPRLDPDDSLADVMKYLESYRGEVPVLEDGRLVGVVWPEDVIERYNDEVFMRDMAGSMASTVGPRAGPQPIAAAGGASVAEVPVPVAFVGRSIAELNVRGVYGVSILMIRHADGEGPQHLTPTPPADYVFAAGDVLLVLGPGDRVRLLQHGNWVAERETSGTA